MFAGIKALTLNVWFNLVQQNRYYGCWCLGSLRRQSLDLISKEKKRKWWEVLCCDKRASYPENFEGKCSCNKCDSSDANGTYRTTKI